MWRAAAWAGVTFLMGYMLYLRSEHEKRHFSVDTYQITSPKIKEREKTLVFLSDLHDNCFGENQEELLAAIDRIKPDAVLIGGDMVVANKQSGKVDIRPSVLLTSELARRYPVYYGLGNHESRMNRERELFGTVYEEYLEQLKQAGVRFVTGRERCLPESDMAVAGVELPEGCYARFSPDRLEASYLEETLGEADSKRFQILLAHSPVCFDASADWGADLTLSGHFHGGTIRIPFLGGLMTPQFQFFYPYCAGMFERAGKYLVVSRGLGTHSVNIRLNDRAQLVAVRLIPESEPLQREEDMVCCK